jgi:hypothetical protein
MDQGKQGRDQVDPAFMPFLPCAGLDLGNFTRTLSTPKSTESWSLTSLREKLIKMGAKVVGHGR